MSWEVSVEFNPSNSPVTANAGPPVQGFYKVASNNSRFVPPTGGKKPYIELTLSIIESSHDASEIGNSIREFVNVPSSDQSDDKRAWTERFLKTAMVGLGHDAASIATANGPLTLGSGVFDGREGYIHYEPYVGGRQVHQVLRHLGSMPTSTHAVSRATSRCRCGTSLRPRSMRLAQQRRLRRASCPQPPPSPRLRKLRFPTVRRQRPWPRSWDNALS